MVALNLITSKFKDESSVLSREEQKISSPESLNFGIGIDIESIDNFPIVADFRSDPFYLDNFTPNEISFCILKQNPLETFAGIFCAKEAVFKAKNKSIRGSNLNQIEIVHNSQGMPMLDGFVISISHSKGLAVAIAIALK